MTIATFAIAGVPPLSGFYSKDLILEKVWEYSPLMCGLLIFAALMTAFYMFRLVFLTFLGDNRDHEKYHHAHESPLLMTGPLMLLAVLSIFSGMALTSGGFFEHLVAFPMPEGAHAEVPAHLGLAVTALVFCAIGFSWFLYGREDFSVAEALKSKLSVAFNVLENRYGFDAFFLGLVSLADRIAKLAFWFDANVIDQFFIDIWALIAQIGAHVSNALDALVVDRTVDGFGGLSLDLGVGLRSLVANGQVQEYLMYIAIAVSLFTTLILSR
jgi:NADH-quinone oxidoreductase subunit L